MAIFRDFFSVNLLRKKIDARLAREAIERMHYDLEGSYLFLVLGRRGRLDGERCHTLIIYIMYNIYFI